MKRTFAILLALLVLLTCGLTPLCSAEGTEQDADAAWKLVSEAYIYAFPLVLTDATRTLSTLSLIHI